jgi:D-lyxose ketol-isomerase
LDFIGSTLNIQTTGTATTKANATGVVGKSVRNKYLSNHTRTNVTTSKVSTTNATQLKALVCKQSSTVGNVSGKKLILQPGESMTINSTMTSKDWAGGGCSPINHGLVNINVRAGNDSYKLFKADQMIVFGKEESNICSAS